MNQKIEEKIEKEVQNKLRQRLLERTKKSASNFRIEFKKQVVIAITAAFGFLIALSWREPIAETINLLLEDLGLKKQLFFKFISALIVTFIGVLILVLISKWNSEKK